MILTGDWHLTDASDDGYRWAIFDNILDYVHSVEEPLDVYILGDLLDRKDRHSKELLNKLVDKLVNLAKQVRAVYILRGNHDTPISGVPYLTFLNSLDAPISYINKPYHFGDSLFLPYSPNPKEEWRDLPFSKVKAVFMHQTVTGALTETGIKLTNENMIVFPRSLKIYSGDIHTPQQVGKVTYVGAPHPVKFGDDYLTRFLVVNNKTFEVEEIVELETIKKHMIRITNANQINDIKTNPGDMAKIFLTVKAEDIITLIEQEAAIREWAAQRFVKICSFEPSMAASDINTVYEAQAAEGDIYKVFHEFCSDEKLSAPVSEYGLQILKGTFT